MRPPNMLSNLSVNASSIFGTETINPKDESRGRLNDTAIASHPRRKTATARRMHCFEFRELLQAQRRKWLPQVPVTFAASGDGPGIGNQMEVAKGYAHADAPAEMGTAMQIGESQELQEIDAALARIGDGSYGTCIACGGEIGRARLKTAPTARRCAPCDMRMSPKYPGDEQ